MKTCPICGKGRLEVDSDLMFEERSRTYYKLPTDSPRIRFYCSNCGADGTLESLRRQAGSK